MKIVFLFSFFSLTLFASDTELEKVGNLAFSSSQQPTPLISLGQHILNKNQSQILLLGNDFQGKDQYFINMIPSIAYGFTDNFSIFISVPVALQYKQESSHSSGLEDLSVQLEYAFYTQEYSAYYDQATLVTNMTFPSGSSEKNPSTGVGSNSFFIGGTYSRMVIDWFCFTSYGGVFNTSNHGTLFGNQLLYQLGGGRRIASTSIWLFDWMIELDGTYSGKNKIHGMLDPNSGGNVVYLTPSLWFSTKNVFLQMGIGLPLLQHLWGNQVKNDYFLTFNTGWTF